MNSKGILILSNKVIEDVISLNLKTYLNLELDIFGQLADAKGDIEKRPDLKFIIIPGEVEKTSPFQELNQFMSSLDRDIYIVSLGDGPEVDKRWSHLKVIPVEQMDDLKSIIKSVANILDISAKDMLNIPLPEYYPIPLHHFYNLLESPSDVFIRIGKGDSSHFIKRILMGDGLDEEVVNRYEKGGVRSLFIKSDQRLNFINKLTERLLAILDSPESTPEEGLKAAETAHETVSENIEVLGITPEIAQMADKAMGVMARQSKDFPKIAGLLKILLSNRSSFRFRHTQITTYLAMAILKNVDWGKKEQYKTLSFVAFFHDIALVSDETCMIHSEEELNNSALSKAEKDIVLKHAQKSAEIIHKYPHMPMGADSIIRQHHGVLNGIGFSESFSGNLSPLTILFIVAEECAHLVLKTEDEKLNKQKIMFGLEQKFKTTRFKKMLEAVEMVL